SRTVKCHYSFMHENLLDMNHQFLHRGILGKIQPKLLGLRRRPGQRTNHVYGLLMIEKPPIPGALHLAWPFIRRFTERVFAEDWNREVFPLILDVRDVLRSNGVPIRSGSALCGAASLCGAAAAGCRLR